MERARAFTGWDFAGVHARVLGSGIPWDYAALARERAAKATSVLDTGTGGGERLAEIAAGLPGHFFASESWPPNARVAARNLGSRGIGVVMAAAAHLPFADGTFDLVLSRHEETAPAEIARILRPGGTFLTQQVAPWNWPELAEFFPRRTRFPDHEQEYARAFAAMGMDVSVRSARYDTAFATLGDLAFCLAVSPWEIPGFDIDRDIDALIAIEARHGGADGIVLTEGRYLLEAHA
ncbi:MAG: class I SAM-dependent methyltransferase [Dehalococcoidia bacterium]|nr:class I SAM-dependent methyltransferase [Dehalococcoidia bacterium]